MKSKMFYVMFMCMLVLLMSACGKMSSESGNVEKSEEVSKQNNVVQEDKAMSADEEEYDTKKWKKLRRTKN